MNPQDPSVLRASDAFQRVSGAAPLASRRKSAPPFSLRLTEEERAALDQQAGGQPLGRYIRDRLLGNDAQPRRKRRKPQVDEKQIALVLAELGHSRLSSNLNQLAKSANMGTLPVSQDVERDLREACAAVVTMRDTLVTALGLKTERDSSSGTNPAED